MLARDAPPWPQPEVPAAVTYAAPLAAFTEIEAESADDGVTVIRVAQDVDPDAPYIGGHFPGFAIYPGVFLVETVAQAAACVLDPQNRNPPRVVAVRSMRFLAPLFASDRVFVHARLRPDRDHPSRIQIEARCERNGTDVATLGLTLEAPEQMTTADATAVRRLPHGHPMVLVDRITSIDPGRAIEAIKAISLCEPCYAQVGPDLPSDRYRYPTSLLLESFGQAAALLWLLSGDERDVGGSRILMLATARNCRIEGSAMPGDVVRHVARIGHELQDNVFVEGESYVGERRIATIASMMAVVRPRGTLQAPDPLAAGIASQP